ncbi:hypothetical protein GCM10010508_35040 [Streptomyces naganishii JCM 4654]|uniref:Integral membrane protein n=2 Tax=Streptomyces naganishii TaxID=285447 RepID=A0A918Y489_9ACTN|nr:hypothetical protein GCM10010508_35040 [Streptomyces naganishii JCM 4654]
MTGYDREHRPAVWEGPVMILEAFGSAVLGVLLAWAALHRLSHRLPARPLVLSTGVAGALFGDFVTHSALGSGSALPGLLGAAVVSAASLSLLLRPAGRLRRRSAPA